MYGSNISAAGYAGFLGWSRGCGECLESSAVPWLPDSLEYIDHLLLQQNQLMLCKLKLLWFMM